MATFRLEIVTAEKMVFAGDVNAVVAWGVEGQLGIFPNHAPLMTMLKPGDLMIRRGNEEEYMAISGGFLDVRPDKVLVLADACERAEEIDAARAEAARRRAEEALRERPLGLEAAAVEGALRRSLARLKTAEKRRRKRMGGH